MVDCRQPTAQDTVLDPAAGTGGFLLAAHEYGSRYSVVLSNPPFGRKSSVTMVGPDGREARDDRETERQDFERFRSFTYDELIARDKANLDVTWLRDASLDDLDDLPAPGIIAREIVDDLTAALAEFEAFATALEATALADGSRTASPPGADEPRSGGEEPADVLRRERP